MKKWLLPAFAAALIAASLFSVAAGNTAYAASKKGAGKVVVYNWSEYIPQDVLDDFTKETGIEVVYSTFESNEAMLAKVKLMKGKGYDVVVPTSYFIDIMHKEGLIQELDHSKLPNLANVDKQWLGRDFDKDNKFSVPYMWGYVGLAYNSQFVKPDQLKSYKDLLRPEFKGKLIMSDDLRDAYCIALRAVGLNTDETSEEGIKKAYEFLKELKPSIRIFDVTAIKQSLIGGEVWAGPIWNGDYLVAAEENPNIKFVFPEEGIILWMDTFAITKEAENVENAHTFINYMLRPDISARCVNAFRYSTPIPKAMELVDEPLRHNAILEPAQEEISKGQFPGLIGNAQPIFQKYWEMLKTDR